MKGIIVFLSIVALVISCYFVDIKPSKEGALMTTSQAVLIEAATPEKTPIQEVVREELSEKAAPLAVQAPTNSPLQEIPAVIEISVQETKGNAEQEVAQEAIEPAIDRVQEEPVAQEALTQEEPLEEVAQEAANLEMFFEEPASEEVAQEAPFEVASEPFFETISSAEVAQEEFAPEIAVREAPCCEEQICCEPVCEEKRWYFEFKPGYYYLTDSSMRQFFDNGGFTFRMETGYRFWKPFAVWLDGSYFQKDGQALGGTEKIDLKLATITLGLKTFFYFGDWAAFYLGAGPRLFMMMMHNDSPFVRGEDNAFGIGGGFDGGFWIFPIPAWPNVFLDLFADYSWKRLHIEADEISSIDSDVDISGLTAGLGLGIRF